jgi:FkbH-like protein
MLRNGTPGMNRQLGTKLSFAARLARSSSFIFFLFHISNCGGEPAMYETEANIKIESLEQVPSEGVAAFARLQGKILTRTVLPWSEHCTECVWPTCYSTCDLYSPREDGRCRRFVDGMVRVDSPTSINRYLIKIRFKQWGKLWTPGSLNLFAIEKADRIENRDYSIGTVLYQLPLPSPIKNVVIDKRYSLKKRLASRSSRKHEMPTAFVLECFNPMDRTIPLSFTIRSSRKEEKTPFQKLVDLDPGFQLIRIPFGEISAIINFDSPFNIELIPNDIGEEISLYFGLMEFVQEAPLPVEKNGKLKCVVWDLDNTLWDGVLVEEGEAKLRPKPGIVDIIQTLDRRGIIQSIASKNNHEQAMQALMQFKLDEFFLYPQISWSPKGEAIEAIARQLNISVDTMFFVDDSEFELQQVKSSCPGVRVIDAKDYLSLLDMKECQVPITTESMNRRKMYQVEQDRQNVATSFRDDYRAFLKHCNIKLTIAPLTEENLERVHELTQRTNQMNFSGSRYDRDVLRKILYTSYLDTYVLTCEDRFGSYGIIGFGMVDSHEPRMTDLMFSCRIQSKRVEHGFLTYLIGRYIALTGKDFQADYRKTLRNMPSGQVFADLGMQEVAVNDGVTSLIFPYDRTIPDDGVIEVRVQADGIFIGKH